MILSLSVPNSSAAKIENLTKTIEDMKDQVSSIRKELETKDNELKQRDRQITELEQSLEDARERFRRRSEEADRLRDDIKTQSDQIAAQQARLKESQVLLAELQAKQIPSEYELNRCQVENKGMKSRIEFLEAELQKTMAVSLESRRELSTKISELESSLVTNTSEKNGLQESLKTLQDQLQVCQERLDSHAFTIRSQETETAEKVASFTEVISLILFLICEIYF